MNFYEIVKCVYMELGKLFDKILVKKSGCVA